MAIECHEIVIGCDNVMKLTFCDVDDVPISMTGERIRVAINRNLKDEPVILKDSDVGPAEIEILSAPNDNCALVKILPADTDGLEEGTYCRSIEVTFNSLSPVVCVVPIVDMVDLKCTGFVGIPSP